MSVNFDSHGQSRLGDFVESILHDRRKGGPSAHVGRASTSGPQFQSLYSFTQAELQKRAYLLSDTNSGTPDRANRIIRVSESFGIDYQKLLVGGQTVPFTLIDAVASRHVTVGNDAYSMFGVLYEDTDTADQFSTSELHKLSSDGVTASATLYGPTDVDDFRGDIGTHAFATDGTDLYCSSSDWTTLTTGIVKLSTTGAVVFGRATTATSPVTQLSAASDAVYALHSATRRIVAWNKSAGTILWSNATSTEFVSVIAAVTGAVYVLLGQRILKLDSSGTVVWSKLLGLAAFELMQLALAADDTGVYLMTLFLEGGKRFPKIVKLDAETGLISFARRITYSHASSLGSSIEPTAIALSANELDAMFSQQLFLFGTADIALVPMAKSVGTDAPEPSVTDTTVSFAGTTVTASTETPSVDGTYSYSPSLSSAYAIGDAGFSA